MRNVHQRELPVPADAVGPYLDRMGGPDDELWPSAAWPPLRIQPPTAVGSPAGHGDIAYTVSAYRPGRRLEFRFDPRIGLTGWHALEVRPDGPDRCVLRHEMRGRLAGVMRLGWPLAVRWLHDAVLEDLLDNAERAVTGTVRTPYRWSRWVRLLRRVREPRTRAVGFPAAARVGHSLPRVDYSDAFEIRLPSGRPSDPDRWWAAGFTPPWDMPRLEAHPGEVFGGGRTRLFDYRAAIVTTGDERRVTATIASVVMFHNVMGRVAFAVIRPGHRLAARAVLRRAARQLTGAAPARVAVE